MWWWITHWPHFFGRRRLKWVFSLWAGCVAIGLLLLRNCNPKKDYVWLWPKTQHLYTTKNWRSSLSPSTHCIFLASALCLYLKSAGSRECFSCTRLLPILGKKKWAEKASWSHFWVNSLISVFSYFFDLTFKDLTIVKKSKGVSRNLAMCSM